MMRLSYRILLVITLTTLAIPARAEQSQDQLQQEEENAILAQVIVLLADRLYGSAADQYGVTAYSLYSAGNTTTTSAFGGNNSLSGLLSGLGGAGGASGLSGGLGGLGGLGTSYAQKRPPTSSPTNPSVHELYACQVQCNGNDTECYRDCQKPKNVGGN